MKLAVISGIKNESDIIESFVRHNSKFIDDFYFIDDSVDQTRKILSLLSAEGFSIHLVHIDTRDYSQSQVNTRATLLINKQKEYDYIFYLDGDEILYYPDKDSFVNRITNSTVASVGLVRALDFVANGKSYFDSQNPLKECFVEAAQRNPVQKVFINGKISDKVIIGDGQHQAFDYEGKPYEYYETNVPIAHFPVRTLEQWTSRVITNYCNVISKREKGPGYGSHVLQQFQDLLARDFVPSHEAFNQGRDLPTTHPVYLDDVICRYQELGRRNVVKEIAIDMERMAKLLYEFRTVTHAALHHVNELANLKKLY